MLPPSATSPARLPGSPLTHPSAKAQAATRWGRALPAFSGSSRRSRAAFCSLLPCTMLLQAGRIQKMGEGVGGQCRCRMQDALKG